MMHFDYIQTSVFAQVDPKTVEIKDSSGGPIFVQDNRENRCKFCETTFFIRIILVVTIKMQAILEKSDKQIEAVVG